MEVLRLKLDKTGKVTEWTLTPGKYWISVEGPWAYVTPMAPSEAEGPGSGASFTLDEAKTIRNVGPRLVSLELTPSRGEAPRKPAPKARTRKEDPHPPLRRALHAGRKAGRKEA
jgi:hypothetical protein